MFNFAGVTHVIENPKGHSPGWNYSLVGSVPTSMMDGHKPTSDDIMAGRVQADGLAYRGRKWGTVQEILEAANLSHDIKLCDSPKCSCRKLF